MSTTNNTSSNKTRIINSKTIYANYRIAQQALVQGQSIRMPSTANADVSVLAAKAFGPTQFTPAEIAAVLESTSTDPINPTRNIIGYTVSTFAGTNGEFSYPSGLAIDANNNLYVTDSYNNRVCKITSDGSVTTFATGFNGPYGLSIDANNNLYVADTDNNSVCKITSDSSVTTFATGFNGPYGLSIDGLGNIYVADTDNNQISKITSDRNKTVFAGDGSSGTTNGYRTDAQFNRPEAVTFDTYGNMYIADYNNNLIRKITSDQVSTFAGMNGELNSPEGLTCDANGTLYITDSDNNRICKIGTDGTIITIAGDGSSGTANGPGMNAQFNYPFGIVFDTNANIYVSDAGNNLIRKLTPIYA